MIAQDTLDDLLPVDPNIQGFPDGRVGGDCVAHGQAVLSGGLTWSRIGQRDVKTVSTGQLKGSHIAHLLTREDDRGAVEV